jgi:hypothetical protein
MKQRSILYLTTLALALLSLGNAFGQATASGTILGTVIDQSQAVVPGAEVVITNKATGEKRTAATNGEGNYRFDLLTAGAYSVKVSKVGFASLVLNVDLLVGQTATGNATLNPGQVSEIVEITSAAPIVDLDKSGVSQNITPTEVIEMPMIQRDVANLAYLAPGVKAADSYDPTKNRYAIISVNGAGGRNVNRRRTGDAASARSRTGIPDQHAAVLGPERPLGRRCHQHDYQAGRQPVSRFRLRLLPRPGV